MHILFIHQVFLAPHEAGSTRHFELAKYLVRKGHQVTIIGSTVNYLTGKTDSKYKGKFIYKESIEGVNIIRTWTYSKIHKTYLSRLISFVSFMISSLIAGFKVEKVDVVIACSPQIFTGITGYILSRIKRLPSFFEIRDLWPRFAIEMKVLTNRRLIWLAQALEKFIYKKADYFIINSPGFYEHLESFGIKKEKIFLIPNGVDTTVFKPSPKGALVRKDLGLDQKFVIMYAGAHGRANNLDTVIEAARILRGNNDIIFVLVGDGKEKKRLTKLRDSYKLNNVLFVDAQPKSKMPEFYSAADICLAILEKNEAFKTVYPNKIFDYMACAKPTLLAIDGVARQIIENAEAGQFVESGDPQLLAEAALVMYKDRESLENYGLNARKYVKEHFEREKIARKLDEVLNRIIANKVN